MKLHFDSNQTYQLDAIKAATDLFDGQPMLAADFTTSFSYGSLGFSENGFANQLLLSEEQIRENTSAIQARNNISNAEEFHGMHFSIEMETGTGKTYVYLRTIYELNKLYGFRKFVIVVPSIAIRIGVLKNLQITAEHFQNLYNKVPVDFNVYESRSSSILRGFAASNNIQILVINIDAFAKDENIINKINETGKKPIEFIQSCHPIVIVDEPQLMESENRKKAIGNLNPLCTLRYSATHKFPYNVLYSLNPVTAYNLGLVKQIEVDSVLSENSMNFAFIQVEKITASKTKTSARIRIDCNSNVGVVRKSVTVSVGDDLFQASNKREIYNSGFFIEEINKESESISFSNGITLLCGETQGGMTEEISRYMIQKTVEEHLAKERSFIGKGIKVLSLFFIDKVKNYREYESNGNSTKGKFAKWFEEIYDAEIAKPKNAALARYNAADVHNGYFSQDTKGKIKDTNGETAADDEVFKLIMEKKEELLDEQTPLRFIFSHSALREGWDNPNVFQICTLNETNSEVKKRQEIGRGLRLPVDQSGQRIFDNKINRLTIIANESYEDFAQALQQEIQEDCNVVFTNIKNKHTRQKVNYRRGFEVDPKFLQIWDRIKFRKQYRVNYSTEELIEKVTAALKDRIRMPETKLPGIRSSKRRIEISEQGIEGAFLGETVTHTVVEDFAVPDVYSYMQDKTGLTRSTIFRILTASGRIEELLVNPQLFMDNVIKIILSELNALMINGIQYERLPNGMYTMELFDDTSFEVYYDKEVDFLVNDPEKTIYQNLIPLDSKIEKVFAKDCETSAQVEFYFKLPPDFKIPTPIGTYNPDWAVVKENEEKVFFIVETKDRNQELTPGQEMKIKCGRAFFQGLEGVSYIRATEVSDLP